MIEVLFTKNVKPCLDCSWRRENCPRKLISPSDVTAFITAFITAGYGIVFKLLAIKLPLSGFRRFSEETIQDGLTGHVGYHLG
mmetsp:Transcript_147403/g.257674  ORF Transcript_147403/g.257674 Transcript_147403/m.257674 type:complete len:83 (+) Transcript_147403:893-1141(+)